MQDLLQNHLLTLVAFSPVVWGLAVLLIPASQKTAALTFALVGSLATFGLSLLLWKRFDDQSAGFQLAETAPWLSDFGIQYFVGVDGFSLLLILLSTFLMPIIVLASWKYIEHRVRSFLFFMFLLETGMIGAFIALDIFLFYVFWEAMLVPMFFIIGVWGGKERIYASAKFMLYTIAGSLPMLVAIIFLLWQYKSQFGTYSASVVDLYKLTLPGEGFFSVQGLIFLAFCLAFAVKVPMFPLHTWLPDAHVQAPTGGSVILAGVLLKLGVYGFIRFAMPLSPQAVPLYAPFFMVISAVAIIYGACVATVQEDVKKLVAYSSVSHMGYVVLGLFSLNQIGLTGSVYQMLNHGISTGALFLLVGILYERRHTRDIKEFGGLATSIPLFSIVMIVMTMSSIALPGTNGFIGEFLILQGAFLSNPWAAAFSGVGVILGAVYMLWLCQRLLFGKITKEENKSIKDLNLREIAYLTPLIVLVFVMGLYPKVFIQKMEKSIGYFSESMANPGTRYAPSISYARDLPIGLAAAAIAIPTTEKVN